jgi:DNA-binding transcriptional ArsR family regulator
MHVDDTDVRASGIAAAIGEPARARMLYSLADGRARTSTELAMVANVTPSTASVHLRKLETQQLVKVFAQGKHRYYSLHRAEVAAALEALSVVAGGAGAAFVPNTPHHLRAARTCYDHIAGRLGVAIYDRFIALGLLSGPSGSGSDCALTEEGARALATLGIDVPGVRALRRRFAFACVDWSERRPHLGGALGSALLHAILKRKWAIQELDSRALQVTPEGFRELATRFGLSRTELQTSEWRPVTRDGARPSDRRVTHAARE